VTQPGANAHRANSVNKEHPARPPEQGDVANERNQRALLWTGRPQADGGGMRDPATSATLARSSLDQSPHAGDASTIIGWRSVSPR